MPDLSVVILSWDGLDLTKRCVASLRAGTGADLEVIIVDNGSHDSVKRAVKELADKALLNDRNLGFAAGMNQGLDVVESPVVVFANNDTAFPSNWDAPLLETLNMHRNAGLVVPAVTASGNPLTVRSEAGTDIERLLPFSEPPSAVVYLMHTKTVKALGGWATDYRIAAGEDWDLCFSLWLQGLEIYYDARVLIEHVSKGTASEKLEDWRQLWRDNRNLFLEKWEKSIPEAGEGIDQERREDLSVVIRWMRQFYHTRDELLAQRTDLTNFKRLLHEREKRIDTLTRQATLSFQLRRIPYRAARKLRKLAGRER